jgi:hypothetical protein
VWPATPGRGAWIKCQRRSKAERRRESRVDLRRLRNEEKQRDPKLAWWKESLRCVSQEVFRNLEGALRDLVAAKKGERKGRRLSFPERKEKG